MEEAKEWFRNVMLSCTLKRLDRIPNNIFWLYNDKMAKQFSLHKKLCKIKRKEPHFKSNFKLIPRKNDEMVFGQDLEKYDFWIEYRPCWLFLETKFNLNGEQITKLTGDVVNEVLNSKKYTTSVSRAYSPYLMNEVINVEEYTTLSNEI